MFVVFADLVDNIVKVPEVLEVSWSAGVGDPERAAVLGDILLWHWETVAVKYSCLRVHFLKVDWLTEGH